MRDFKVLIYLDMLKLKNQILEIFKSPIQILKKSFGLLYFLGMACFIIFTFKLGNSKAAPLSNVAFINTSVIIGILSIILVLSILINLFSNYTPSNFILSDIQYLFPSPLDNKNILLYSLIKSSLKGVLTSLLMFTFFIILIIFKFGSSILTIINLSLGIFFIFMFFMSLGYLIFSFRVKFSLDKEFKIFSHILKVLIAIFALTLIYFIYSYNFNINEAFNYLYNNILFDIPFINSMVVIFSSALPNSTNSLLLHSLILLCFAVFNFIVFLKLNVDYYEDIAEKVEEKDTKIKEVLSSSGSVGKNQIDNNMKKVNFSATSKERYGVMALFWKNSIMRKRRATPIKKYVLFAVNIIIGAIGAYFTYTLKAIYPIFIIAVITVYFTLIFATMTELYRELKTLYIHLIPGSPISKILASSLDELLILAFRILIMLLPAIIVSGKNIPLAFIVLLVTLTSCTFLKLQSIILVFILPDKPTNPPILYMLYTMIIIAIPAAIGGAVFALTSNYYFALALIEIIFLAYIGCVVLLCEKLFEKIQY